MPLFIEGGDLVKVRTRDFPFFPAEVIVAADLDPVSRQRFAIQPPTGQQCFIAVDSDSRYYDRELNRTFPLVRLIPGRGNRQEWRPATWSRDYLQLPDVLRDGLKVRAVNVWSESRRQDFHVRLPTTFPGTIVSWTVGPDGASVVVSPVPDSKREYPGSEPVTFWMSPAGSVIRPENMQLEVEALTAVDSTTFWPLWKFLANPDMIKSLRQSTG